MLGGEFEIDLSIQCDAFKPALNTYYYSSGRAALYQILKSLKDKMTKIWFPDWLCHTMVRAAQKAGFEYEFYELSDKFVATVESLDAKGFKDGGLVLLINYFGLQDLTITAKAIKEAYPNAIIIEDDVQAYYCFAEETNPYADYRFTSLRKTFSSPDGGLVYTKHPMPLATQPNTFAKYKIEAGVMKYHRGEEGIKDEDYLALFEKGSELIDENYDSSMSLDSQRLFAGTDLHWVKQRRQENAAYLLEGLKSLGIVPLIEVPKDKVPLFVPIWLEDRNTVRKKMFQKEVFCPVHWPLEGLPLKKGAEMAQHELSLIVDQRYSHMEMEEILTIDG
jgi:hypothetical protein